MTLLEFMHEHPVFTIILIVVVGAVAVDIVRAFRGRTDT